MTARRRHAWTACCLMCLSPLVAAGAGPNRGSWNEVQNLAKGQRIKITTKSDKIHTGAFAGLTDASLLMEEGTSEVGIRRDDVLRVETKQAGRRARNALIGAGVGLALGVLIDQTVGAYVRNETGEAAGARAATIALPAALFGGIAAAFPGYRVVYRAPKQRP